MLEVLLVVGLCTALGKKLRAKGRKPLWMQVGLVFAWILGELVGGFIAGIIHVIRNGENAPMGFEVYAFALVGAAIGAATVFLIAHLMPDLNAGPPQPQSIDPFDRKRDDANPYAP